MAAKLAELRKQAKDMGISKAAILSAKTPAALQQVIDAHNGTGDAKAISRPVKKAKAKAATAPRRKPGRPRKAQPQAQTQEAPKRRGRPPKSASSKSVPAKSTRGRQAKRPTTAKTNGSGEQYKRHTLGMSGNVNFKLKHEGWNPRPDSPPDQIIKALAAHKGDRDAVYEELAPRVSEFVKPNKNDGTKRTKAEKLAMLKYRIARTAWEFAMRTEQHDKAEGRATYGEGGTGFGIFTRKTTRKPAARKPATRSQAKPKPARRGRPPKATPKPAPRRKPAAKPQSRTKPATRRSKPKPKARAGRR